MPPPALLTPKTDRVRGPGSAASRKPGSAATSRSVSSSPRRPNSGFTLTAGAKTRPEDLVAPMAGMPVGASAASAVEGRLDSSHNSAGTSAAPALPVVVPRGGRLPDSRPSTAGSAMGDEPRPASSANRNVVHPSSARTRPPRPGKTATQQSVLLGESGAESPSARSPDKGLASSTLRSSVADALSSIGGADTSPIPRVNRSVRADDGGNDTSRHDRHDSSQGDVMSTAFRSTTLQLEIALRELIADSASVPPSTNRIRRVFQLYDTFIGAAPQSVSDLLRMFRVEFCRAIFAPAVSDAGKLTSTASTSGGGAMRVPYFERFDALTKEINMLQAEVEANEKTANVEQLQHKIAKMESLGSYYEHEISRLGNENKKLAEEIDRMAVDAELTAQNNQKVFTSLDEQNRKLSRESRELQLQVFRLRKEARDQVASYNLYTSLRTVKMEELTRLWEQGCEKSALLVSLHQLEAVINGRLVPFEHTLVRSTQGEISAARIKFVRDIQYVMDEYHDVNLRRNALEMAALEAADEPVDPDSTGWRSRTTTTAAADSAMGRVEAMLTPRAPPSSAALIRRRSSAISLGHSVSEADMARVLERPDIAVSKSHGRVYERGDNRRWGEVLFGSAMGKRAHTDPTAAIQTWDARSVTSKDGALPLFEVGGDRFMSGVDLCVGSNGEYECLKTFAWLDPSIGVEFPAKTTHAKVKFHNPMSKKPARNFGAEDVLKIDLGNHSWAKRWLPEEAEGASTTAALAGEGGSPPREFEDAEGNDKTAATGAAGANKDRVAGENASDDDDDDDDAATGDSAEDLAAALGDAHWDVFRGLYGKYQPFLPRQLPVDLIDTVMNRTFQLHRRRLRDLYDKASSIAQGRSSGQQMHKVVTERFFRDEFKPQALQQCLFDVLETVYVQQELVMKVGHELLTNMENYARESEYPHMRVYLGCLGATVASPMGRVLAMAHTLLAQFWPLASTDRNVAVSESDLMAVLRGIYPSEGSVRVNYQELATEITLSCDGEPSLERVKRYFTDALLHLTEPVIAKSHEAVVFKTALVHWSELDSHNFWEAIRTMCSEDAAVWTNIQHLASCCLYERQGRLPPEELSHIAAEIIWTESAKHRPSHL